MTMANVGLPEGQRAVLEAAVAGLREVRGVVAVVLGGSWAAGMAREGSDVDLGVYYREGAGLDVEGVRAVAERLSVAGAVPVVTELYGWGPWVNGGAWIQTAATKVDFVYRNVEQVWRVIEEGQRGVWRHDYDQQPPFGFRSVVYLGETRVCVALHDPAGVVAELQEAVAEYPEALRRRIVEDGLWGAEFSLWSGAGFADGGDVVNTAGCLARAGQYLVQALFALNGVYFLNDKHAARMVEGFAKKPERFGERVAGVLGRVGGSAEELRGAVAGMRGVWAEMVELTAGAYRARFDLGAAKG